MKFITTVMNQCITVMKTMTARDEKFHDGGYNFMPPERSIFWTIGWLRIHLVLGLRESGDVSQPVNL